MPLAGCPVRTVYFEKISDTKENVAQLKVKIYTSNPAHTKCFNFCGNQLKVKIYTSNPAHTKCFNFCGNQLKVKIYTSNPAHTKCFNFCEKNNECC